MRTQWEFAFSVLHGVQKMNWIRSSHPHRQTCGQELSFGRWGGASISTKHIAWIVLLSARGCFTTLDSQHERFVRRDITEVNFFLVMSKFIGTGSYRIYLNVLVIFVREGSHEIRNPAKYSPLWARCSRDFSISVPEFNFRLGVTCFGQIPEL